ncbi:MAG: sulfatase [Bacillota bacterium]|nr:sulfatase [Bacillota bacterium]
MKSIFILCDTTNRRALELYGSANPAITPNLNRLAERGMIFDNHWCGSAPCMPARRDIMTGRLGFLERPWGGIEPFDYPLGRILGHGNVHSQMFTDHSLYLMPGGENYINSFTCWDVIRGQEFDPWSINPDKGGIRSDCKPDGYKGTYAESYRANRAKVQGEQDYPSVQTLTKAADWLEENAGADNFLLWIETFDPHEPFDVPKEYVDLYEEEQTASDVFWPTYEPNIFTEEETKDLNLRYKALLTMTDRYIGKLLDVMDQNNLWEDTMVIFTTDHGYLLGEHGYMAKNYMPPYNEVFHIPLVIAAPGVQAGRCNALTQNIDILPTLMEFYDVPDSVLHYPLHGKSLLPLLRREQEVLRDGIIYGYYGKSVGYTDGIYTYIRAAASEENRPLYLYAGMPTILRQSLGADSIDPKDYDKIEMGKFLPYTDYPVYRFPADVIHYNNPSQEFSKRSDHNGENLLFSLREDYDQQKPIRNAELEGGYAAKLADCMKRHDSPSEQFQRLGLPTSN